MSASPVLLFGFPEAPLPPAPRRPCSLAGSEPSESSPMVARISSQPVDPDGRGLSLPWSWHAIGPFHYSYQPHYDANGAVILRQRSVQ
jgi:hypothetical protein